MFLLRNKVMPLLCMMLPFSLVHSADPGKIIYNFEKGNSQSILTGHIDNWTITRGNAQFAFGPGDLTLFDFESGRIAAMTYTGQGRFHYSPPNEVERYQLYRFTDSDTLDDSFDKLTLFFTVDLEQFPDTAAFNRTQVSKSAWNQLSDAAFEIFDHTWYNVANDLIGDLLADGAGSYFAALFDLKSRRQMLIVENPLFDDLFNLYSMERYSGLATYDKINGYSPDNDLPSERGFSPIDITHYDIDAKIGGDGDMDVKCWIHFMPIRSGRRHFQLYWNNKNELISARDSRGNPLLVVQRHKDASLFYYKMDEANFGVIFDSPLEVGREDSILIYSKSGALEEIYGLFFIKDGVYWYPHNSARDIATYDITFDCPEQFQVIGCGDCISSRIQEGRCFSKWKLAQPAAYVSFDVGSFDSREFDVDSLAPIKIFASDKFRHGDMALSDLTYYGSLSQADILGAMGKDVTNSLAFFTSIFGPCQFDTIRAVEWLHKVGYYSVIDTMGAASGLNRISVDTEDKYAYLDATVATLPRFLIGEGSPGLLRLSYELYQSNRVGAQDDVFKANVAAFQWWGLMVDTEVDRDYWITYGLAHYCGLWFYQMSAKDKKSYDDFMNLERQRIMGGYGPESVGAKAGPVVMGHRLSSTKSEDFDNIVRDKAAYIFHMIRYLLHDYKTGNDDAFAAFLKDLAIKYKGKIITTEKLRALLEDHVGGDMGWFFDQWVYGTAIPKYTFSSKWENTLDKKYQVTCKVKQENVPDNFEMIVPITILFDDDKYIHFKIRVDRPETDIDLPFLPYEPKKIIFNTYDAVLCEVSYR